MKKVFICFMLCSTILVGCGSSASKKICTMKQNSEAKLLVTNTIEYKEDTVSAVIMKNEIDLKKNKYFTDEMLESYAKGVEKSIKDIDGVAYSYTLSKDRFVETTEASFTDDKETKEIMESKALGIYVSLDNEKMSMKKMVKMMEDTGMSCK